MIVHIARTAEGRRVQEILDVGGYENGHYVTHTM
jgi:type IV secretion system protein VirB11